ncbi:TetR family transcriptional regulator [Amycolatopsis pithecellobii]|uniref:TetR family transcriptional regulator n=1 Tax=Amycolatopsis pithecellobii TaxID=664692 RepID=A0A6N7Z194_9PSEU|nr:TetR family transcriptional regulator [Amycolatopsis pithecellobii]MTD53284.1 TetR family transcriptional regulator [Amycolatopsis pithecellobii]
MAWDTARTKQRLLDAAVFEYSEHGPLGARVDRVAASAGVNKERIYQYFGGKQKLFGAVLEQEMIKLAAAVPLSDEQARDLGEFAGRVWDYHRTYPHYLRLLLWEGLDRDPLESGRASVAAAAERSEHYADNVRAVAKAQADGFLRADVAPAHLLYVARALAAWWLAAPSAVTLMLGEVANESPQDRRRVLVKLVNDATKKS